MIKRLYNYILHRRLHAEGVQRALTAPDKASQDSKPAMFAALALAELDKVRRRQIERVCPLDYLSVESDEPTKARMVLQLKNRKENALKQLVQIVNN